MHYLILFFESSSSGTFTIAVVTGNASSDAERLLLPGFYIGNTDAMCHQSNLHGDLNLPYNFSCIQNTEYCIQKYNTVLPVLTGFNKVKN